MFLTTALFCARFPLVMDERHYLLLKNLFNSMSSQDKAWIWPDGQFHIDRTDEGSLVARFDGKSMIAAAWFTRSEDMPENTHCITIFIHPDYRGFGYGEDMIRTFFARYEKENVEILAKIDVDNFRSKRFFEKATTVVRTEAHDNQVYVYCLPQQLEKRVEQLEEALILARREIADLQNRLLQHARDWSHAPQIETFLTSK